MKNSKVKTVLGAAFLGVLLAGLMAGNVAAKVSNWVFGEALRIASPSAATSGTPDVALVAGAAYIQGALEVDGAVRFDGAITQTGQTYEVVVATQNVGASGTIAADACGSVKRISLPGIDATTDTTNTITAPAAGNAGCKMLIVNVSTSAVATLYMDANALFPVTGAASLAIGPKGSIWVWSDGSRWLHGPWTEY